MKHTILNSLLSALVITSTAATAASHNKLVFLNEYDLDGDGDLVLAEFDHARERRFNQTDEDNSGTVDANEYLFEYQNRMDDQLAKDRYGQVKQTIVRFNALDKNQDDRMQWDEYQASGIRSFNRYDVNQDGVINQLDPQPENRWEHARKNQVKTAEQLAQDKRDKLLRAKRLLRMPTTHDRQGFFTKYDLDQNDIITEDEFSQKRRADFDRTDEDNNGWLTEQEYTFEYENRLDQQIARTRKAAIKQTHVRFGILDKDKNGSMTLGEYQLSGHRGFQRWDTNQDGIVNNSDPAPKKRKAKTAKSTDYKS
ncbi:hypothetical protein RS130_18890 [Paraglaciecola aquimarina]|uniref:Uncharacterized protein n=1 Tax=Paraglaciecola aquimarina TaxID=1235557 RepID=A0ABU3T0A7_9ALTE|nr:hypothetical protein [Paraglaciecola aquimarina]MDU0355673.1 hypothetical protein [Paraglaciecola aquimarina]